MAQKFNNNENNLSVRTKLNGNADEIDILNDKIENAILYEDVEYVEDINGYLNI